MAYLTLACQAIVAVTFTMSVAVKVGRTGYADFRRSLPVTLRIPERRSGPVASGVVAAEAGTATLMVLGLWLPVLALAGFVLAALVLVGFTVAIGVMINRRVSQPCQCFGTSNRPPGRRDVVRNVALVGVAALGAGSAVGRPAAGVMEGEWMSGAVALLAGLSLANLAFTVAVVRRLREQNELLRRSVEGVTNPEPVMLTAGEAVRHFVASTTDGQPLSREDLRGETLVAFLSVDCPACAESVPSFIQRAELAPGGRERVLAVLEGDPPAATRMRDRLAPVARVVVEPKYGPVSRAFGVTEFPAFALLSGATVVGSHFVLDRVPATATA